MDNINIWSFKVVTTKNSNGNLPPDSPLTPTFMGRVPCLIYYINFIMIHPHTVRVLVIVKCVFDGPGFGNINNINQIALYLFVSSRGRERSSFTVQTDIYSITRGWSKQGLAISFDVARVTLIPFSDTVTSPW